MAQKKKKIKKYQDTAIKYIFKLLYINFFTRSIKQSDLKTQFSSYISFFKTWYGIYIFYAEITHPKQQSNIH